MAVPAAGRPCARQTSHNPVPEQRLEDPPTLHLGSCCHAAGHPELEIPTLQRVDSQRPAVAGSCRIRCQLHLKDGQDAEPNGAPHGGRCYLEGWSKRDSIWMFKLKCGKHHLRILFNLELPAEMSLLLAGKGYF